MEGEEHLRDLLKSDHPSVASPEFQVSIHSQLAFIDILSPDPVRWPAARERAQGAYREAPWDDAVTLVYGTCVALTDGVEPGARILDTVVRKTKEIDDFRISIRALLLARVGRLGEAADVLATARPPKSFDVFRPEIARLLGGGSPTKVSTTGTGFS